MSPKFYSLQQCTIVILHGTCLSFVKADFEDNNGERDCQSWPHSQSGQFWKVQEREEFHITPNWRPLPWNMYPRQEISLSWDIPITIFTHTAALSQSGYSQCEFSFYTLLTFEFADCFLPSGKCLNESLFGLQFVFPWLPKC